MAGICSGMTAYGEGISWQKAFDMFQSTFEGSGITFICHYHVKEGKEFDGFKVGELNYGRYSIGKKGGNDYKVFSRRIHPRTENGGAFSGSTCFLTSHVFIQNRLHEGLFSGMTDHGKE